MPPIYRNVVRHNMLRTLPMLITLAFWHLRQNWRLLALLEGGMLCAVILVCTVPLFSQVALTAGVRGLLQQAPNAYLTVSGGNYYRNVVDYPFLPRLQHDQQQATHTLQQHLGTYIYPNPQLIVDSDRYFLPIGIKQPEHPTGGKMQFHGFDMSDIAAHLKVVQGRLPQANPNELEIAVLPQTAQQLEMTIGATISFPLNYESASALPSPILTHFVVRLVGIFTVNSEDDPIWHNRFFETDQDPYHALVSINGLIPLFGQSEREANTQGATLSGDYAVSWYYHLDSTQLDVNHVQTLLTDFSDATNAIISHPNLTGYVFGLSVLTPDQAVVNYEDRIQAVRVPELLLLLLIISLIMIFISTMSELLAEQQALQVAMLHSRGASYRQLFVTIGIQSLLLGLVALLLGPWLALLVARILTLALLVPNDWSALNVLDDHLLAQISSVLGVASLVLFFATGTMLLSYITSVTENMLSLRRESSRSRRQPLWMRLMVDVVMALIGLVCYGCFLYVLNSGVLTAQTRLLLLSPLLLLAAFLLLLAGCLFFLRLFPTLLTWTAQLAAYSRSADAVLAMAQMARAPRQNMRQVLLLSLAIAFTLFTQVFLASQWQRLPAVAASQAGADFSGVRATLPIGLTPSLEAQTQSYRTLPGVVSATLGYSEVDVLSNTPVVVQAVDAQSFATTVNWTQQDESVSLANLTQQLVVSRSLVYAQQIIPAIVDATTWQALHLTLRTPFVLDNATGSLSYLPIAEVQQISTITAAEGANNGVLVDYQTYATVYNQVLKQSPPLPASVWLRTRDDAASLTALRAVLTNGSLRLSPLYDRRQLLTQLQQDPLLLVLVGTLVLGAIIPLVFAIGGSGVAFWLSARNRLTNIAILRALGSTPRQVSRMLLWEQGIVYSTALILGSLFGCLLAFLALPALIFSSLPPNGITSTSSTTLLYALQNVPPVRITLPLSLGISLFGLVVLIVATFSIMVGVVMHPSISQRLRLNED